MPRNQMPGAQLTVVQNVQMEELFINGLTQNNSIEELDVPTKNPLKTERFIAKFKGRSPIMNNGRNFLNRQKMKKRVTDGSIQQMTEIAASPNPGQNTERLNRQSMNRKQSLTQYQQELDAPKKKAAFEIVAYGQKKETVNVYH